MYWTNEDCFCKCNDEIKILWTDFCILNLISTVLNTLNASLMWQISSCRAFQQGQTLRTVRVFTRKQAQVLSRPSYREGSVGISIRIP